MISTTKINWNKDSGLVPAVIQDSETGTVLMLGYMSKQSLVKTLKTKKVWFYSRSKKRLWMKGETSGNFLKLVGINPDCDGDALLVSVNSAGPACHTGQYSCFKIIEFRDILLELFSTIEDRKKNMPKNSYTSSLFKAGLFKICSKVAEELGEVIKAATKESKQRLVEESADLIYHLFVLLTGKNIKLPEIYRELKKRQTKLSQ